MSDVKWLSEPEHRAWRGWQQLHMLLEGALARRLATESCLSQQDYAVLVVLTDREPDAMRLFELGHMLGWEKSRLSHHINRMTKRGLVTKEKCEVDGRGWVVVITDHGRAEIEAAAPGHVRSVRELFIDQLTPDELAAIATISDRLIAQLDDPDCPG